MTRYLLWHGPAGWNPFYCVPGAASLSAVDTLESITVPYSHPGADLSSRPVVSACGCDQLPPLECTTGGPEHMALELSLNLLMGRTPGWIYFHWSVAGSVWPVSGLGLLSWMNDTVTCLDAVDRRTCSVDWHMLCLNVHQMHIAEEFVYFYESLWIFISLWVKIEIVFFI